MLKFKTYFLVLGLLSCHVCMPLQFLLADLRRVSWTFGIVLTQAQDIRTQALALIDVISVSGPITSAQRARVLMLNRRCRAVSRQYGDLRSRMHMLGSRIWRLSGSEESRLYAAATDADGTAVEALAEVQRIMRELLLEIGVIQEI